MLVFPQLSSGANVQYPLVCAVLSRTVANIMQDGSIVKFEDIAAGRTRWELRLESLDESERMAVEQLFVAAEGELTPFILLDPASNLLSWSEDFSKSSWVKDPLLDLVGGLLDVNGGSVAWRLTNSGQSRQQIAQSIGGPGQFDFCFSSYVRGSGNVSLVRSSDGVSDARTFQASDEWQRVSSAGRLGAASDTFTVAIALDPGTAVEVFGPQLEAQPGAGPYRQSLGVSGAYRVRFESSRLQTTAVGLDRNSSVIRLVTVE